MGSALGFSKVIPIGGKSRLMRAALPARLRATECPKALPITLTVLAITDAISESVIGAVAVKCV